MVIWIVFTTVDSNVYRNTHRTPHQVVSTVISLIPAGVLRETVMLSRASWCQLQRAPLGKLLKLQARFPEYRTHNAGVEGPVPPFPDLPAAPYKSAT